MNKRNLLIVCGICLMLVSISASAKTVAYWRFEAGPAGTNIQHGAAAGVYSPDVLDVSGNGNHLAVWTSSQWQYRANVPYATVPNTGEANLYSVKNVTSYPSLWNKSLATWEPAQWTIEATFKAENNGTNGGWKTIVGRDSRGIPMMGENTNGDLAALYLQTTDSPARGLAIKFIDKAGYWHSAEAGPDAYVGFNYSSDPDGNNAPWYSIAATSDGRWLRLYLYNHSQPQNGYVKIAETDMTVVNPGSTNTALNKGAGDGSDWDAGDITVGRGMYAGGHGDRFYGYIDEVRLSDKALKPSEFLMAPGYVKPVSPAKDEFLATTAATTYTWTTNTEAMNANNVVFDRYIIYIANNAADLTPEIPTTYLHSNTITNVATQSYSGYNGTYAYSEDYFWRIDMVAMDPNETDPNHIVYNVPHLYQGMPVRFFGPRACPAVTISGNVSIVPDPITQIYTAQNAVFTADIARGNVNVAAISWYKVNGVQDKGVFDPNDLPDSLISHVPGVTQITYTPNLATATSTTLTIVNATPANNGSYYAKVRLVDPLGGSTGCEDVSPTAELFVRDDTHASTNYLVHRYGFDGNANDSIGTAHGTVVDLGDVNHAFQGGQLVLNNAGLNSRPIQNEPGIGDRLLDAQGAYVDLPNGLISPLGKSATFMAWFTFTPVANDAWPRIFDFGTSTGGEGFATGADGVKYINGLPYLDTAAEDKQEYVMLTPQQGTGSSWRFESQVRPPSNSVYVDPSDNTALKNVEVCVTCVFDAVSGYNTVYLNGVQVLRSANTTHSLANINDVNNWLGRSQWPDAMFTGKLNEFRIYDVALSKYWVKAYYLQGPDDYLTRPNPCIQDEANAMDFNSDCSVDMLDFAEFAQQWLSCDRLYGCN